MKTTARFYKKGVRVILDPSLLKNLPRDFDYADHNIIPEGKILIVKAFHAYDTSALIEFEEYGGLYFDPTLFIEMQG